MDENLDIAAVARELAAAKAILRRLAWFGRSARERILGYVINSSAAQADIERTVTTIGDK